MGIEQNVNQVEQNNKEKTKKIVKGGLIGAGLVALGYVFGSKYTSGRISNGIEKCCLVDPSFEDHFKTVLKEVKNRRESMKVIE